jgi:hypothetical protein
MKKFILILLIFISCNKETSLYNKFEIYDKHIEIPVNFSVNKTKKETNNTCYREINLKDSTFNSYIKVRVCGYGYSYRKSFKKLNLFVDEEYDILLEERIDLVQLKNNSSEGSDYYYFSYEFLVEDKFYSKVYLAYKDCYISINFSTEKINNSGIEDFKKTIYKLKNNQDLSKVNLPEDFEVGCLSCKYPYFW